MVSSFEFAVGPVLRIRFVMEAAVGERAAEALVEEQEQESQTARLWRLTGRRNGGHRVGATRVL